MNAEKTTEPVFDVIFNFIKETIIDLTDNRYKIDGEDENQIIYIHSKTQKSTYIYCHVNNNRLEMTIYNPYAPSSTNMSDHTFSISNPYFFDNLKFCIEEVLNHELKWLD